VFRRGPDKDGFSLGKRGNLAEVFGDEWWSFCFPVFSSFGDGLTFPQRLSDDAELGLSTTTTHLRWAGGRMGWEEGEESMPMLGGQEEGSWKVEDESDSEEEVVLHTAVLPNSSAVSPAKDFVNVTIDS